LNEGVKMCQSIDVRGADSENCQIVVHYCAFCFAGWSDEGQMRRLTDPASHETVEGTLDPMFCL